MPALTGELVLLIFSHWAQTFLYFMIQSSYRRWLKPQRLLRGRNLMFKAASKQEPVSTHYVPIRKGLV